MSARHVLLSAFVVVTATAILVACDENPPESAYDTPTPYPSPAPGVTPVAVAVPQDGTSIAVSGRIEVPGERDAFTFLATTGDRLRIDVDAQGMSPSSGNLDAVITLFGTDGNVLSVTDDGTNLWDLGTASPGALRDPYLVATAPANGEYTLVIEDANGGGDDNDEFNYSISFSLVQSIPLNGGISCAAAVALPSLVPGGTVSVTGGIDDASTDSCCDTTQLPCVGGTVSGRDVLYTANLTSGQRVQITRTGPGFDGAVYVTTDCVGNQPASIIDSCEAGADGSDDADGVVFTPQVTGLYYVHVDSVTGTNGLFTLDVRSLTP